METLTFAKDLSSPQEIGVLYSVQKRILDLLKITYHNFSQDRLNSTNSGYGRLGNDGIDVELLLSSFTFWMNGFLSLFTIVTLLSLVFYAITHWTRTARLLNKFPGPRQLPFLGNFTMILGPYEDLQGKISKAISEYGLGTGSMRLWFGYKPVLVVANGKIAEKVLTGYANVEKGDNYGAFHRVLNQSLVTAPGPKWRKDRRSLNPAVGFQYLDGFMKIFNEQAKILAEIMSETFNQDDEPDKFINLLPYFNRATMDSVFQTVLGSKQEAQRNPQLEFVEKMKGIVKVTRLKLLRPYLDFPVIWRLFGYGDEEEKCINALMNYSKVLIDAKFKEREETGAVTGTATRPFLAYLMDGTDDREDIAYHINALMFAGAETTASGMNYLLFLLALNPSVQNRLIEEVDVVFTSRLEDDQDVTVTQADLTDLKYTECCIKEALRLYPPVAGWFRRITKDVVLDDGKIIPRDAQVAILPYEIHRNTEIFPDPERFDPDRFSPENRDKIPTGWWIPFSHGPRNCIGHRYAIMQMKTMMVKIFTRFTAHTKNTREELKMVYGLVLEPTPEIKITLKKRT
ncbi:cytochrome P450 4c3 [Folsomia candida]|uniref:Cytochrome P450 4c3 n=1 Tax=Folsomia candida TaxID=158441 RepID=A0A226EG21_FOLCA|nr:cytochrome P450 4c3 [Folsomia candida]OXA56014.1 Cytochrome P450 4c3 [Folsomia candida]